MLRVKHKGNYQRTINYLGRIKKPIRKDRLRFFGEQGVAALKSATPVDTGLTAHSWYYEIIEEDGKIRLQFNNANVINYIPIAIILQYGHATGTGGWVEGRDYINPAIRPVFDKLADDAWEEVTRV